MSEAALWQWLRPRFREAGALVVRVENGVGPGTPDLTWCRAGRSGWIELKWITASQASAWDVATLLQRCGLGREQRLWLDAWLAAGGRCGVLVGSPKKIFYYPWAGPGRQTCARADGEAVRYALRRATG